MSILIYNNITIMLELNKIYCIDVLEGLKKLDDASTVCFYKLLASTKH